MKTCYILPFLFIINAEIIFASNLSKLRQDSLLSKDYQVYCEIIPQFIKLKLNANGQEINIYDQTTLGINMIRTSDSLRRIIGDSIAFYLYSNFENINSNSYKLRKISCNKFSVNIVASEVEIDSSKFIDEYLKSYWDHFKQKNRKSNCIFTISKPSYYTHNELELAILYLGYYSGPLSGEGYMLFLKRINGQWRIIYCERKWIS